MKLVCGSHESSKIHSSGRQSEFVELHALTWLDEGGGSNPAPGDNEIWCRFLDQNYRLWVLARQK
jgi:hypothetical protein